MVRENQKQQVQGKVGLGRLYAALGMVLASRLGPLGWERYGGLTESGLGQGLR